jgi:predicted ArsR family transcriptional regulator
MTATEAAALVGESPSSCSFHLRELARRGFVEEAGTGHGRQRPWRLVTMGSSIQTTDLRGDAEAVGENVLDLWHNRALVRLRHWLEHRRSASRSLRAASSFNSTVAWATPAEMKKLNQTIAAVMDPYRDRAYDPELRPAAAQPFELLYFSYPIADQIELMRQPKRPKDP